MKINSIQRQNYQYNIPSFNGVKISRKNQALYQISNPIMLKRYIAHADKLENMKIDLREMVKSWKLSPAMIYVLKNFFGSIGEEETHNFSVDFDDYGDGNVVSFFELDHELSDSVKSYYIHLQKSILGYSIIAGQDDKKQRLFGRIKQYGDFRLPTENLVLSAVNKTLKADVVDIAKEIDKRCAEHQKKEELEIIRDGYNGVTKKFEDMEYIRKYHPEKIFDKSSLICTLDDILDYIDRTKEWNDYRQRYYIYHEAFNKPVTKDGESLLIALAHVLPTAENADKYAKLVDELSHYYINFNQKDSMGISFIEHVLNSRNRFLLTLAGFRYARDGLGGAYNSYYGLRYEPMLENVFNSIKDQDFKDLVLKLDLFNNMYNLKFKTIFGQPNPKL